MSDSKHRLLEKSLSILNYVSKQARPVTFKEMCDYSGLTKSTVHNLIQTLVSMDYLVKLDSTNRYSIGLQCFQTGNAYIYTNPFYSMAVSVTYSLALSANKTTNLGTLSGSDVVYLYKIEGDIPIHSCTFIGKKISAHGTAIGKSMLAYLPDNELEELFKDKKLTQITENTISTFDDLMANLNEIRKTGIAYESEESAPFVKCIGVSAVGSNKKPLVGLSIALPLNNAPEKNNELIQLLLNAKNRIESMASTFDF